MKNIFNYILLIVLLSSFNPISNISKFCYSDFEISFYSEYASKKAALRNESPIHDEIHIIIKDGEYIFNGEGYSKTYRLLDALIEYQEDRVYVNPYFFTIGVGQNDTFEALENLFCTLSDLEGQVKHENIVKIFMY